MIEYESTESLWERGASIHPRAREIMEKARKVDSGFDWKFGGDGDNGEEMLLILTSVFNAEPDPIEALHDAIRRPMGVVPESAEPFITTEGLEAAEARRPRIFDSEP